MNICSEMPQEIGKKVGIHFCKNILSEINLPLLISVNFQLLTLHVKLVYFQLRLKKRLSDPGFIEKFPHYCAVLSTLLVKFCCNYHPIISIINL